MTRPVPTGEQADAIAAKYPTPAVQSASKNGQVPVSAEPVSIPAGSGAKLLDDVHEFIGRYVAFPSLKAGDAVTLWAAHAHAVEAFESTPRLALLSPEKGSGKTRCLEVLELLVPVPMHAVNATAAALFRAVEAHSPTLLFDEADTFFGPMARGEHEELRGLINAGHRRGAVAYRCVGDPAKMQVKAFPSFCAVALAGIGDLPDTILDRSVLVRMRRRAPGETVTPFRYRSAKPAGAKLHERLAEWAKLHADPLGKAEPDMPAGLVDRPADVWEPLIAIGDAAGGTWPKRARDAALALNADRAAADTSLGVRLLGDVRAVFATLGDGDAITTESLLERLCAMDEAPWGAMPGRGAGAGKPLDARGLARRLKPYDVRPVDVRSGENVRKGYRRADLRDAWSRYLSDPQEAATSATSATAAGQRPAQTDDVADVADPMGVSGALPPGWQWQAQDDPLGHCWRCGDAAYALGPDERPVHPSCWRGDQP